MPATINTVGQNTTVSLSWTAPNLKMAKTVDHAVRHLIGQGLVSGIDPDTATNQEKLNALYAYIGNAINGYSKTYYVSNEMIQSRLEAQATVDSEVGL